MRRLAAVLSLLLMASSAQSADNVSFTMGAGNASCSSWMTARQQGSGADEAAVISWMHGYITAVSERTATSGRPGNIIGSTPATEAAVDADLWAFLDNYCAQHPANILHDAAIALTNGLLARQTIEGSPASDE